MSFQRRSNLKIRSGGVFGCSFDVSNATCGGLDRVPVLLPFWLTDYETSCSLSSQPFPSPFLLTLVQQLRLRLSLSLPSLAAHVALALSALLSTSLVVRVLVVTSLALPSRAVIFLFSLAIFLARVAISRVFPFLCVQLPCASLVGPCFRTCSNDAAFCRAPVTGPDYACLVLCRDSYFVQSNAFCCLTDADHCGCDLFYLPASSRLFRSAKRL